MKETNVKWQQLSVEDAVRTQQSNAAWGLSLKAARSRRKRRGANTLFDSHTVGFHAWRSLLSDPAQWLMLIAIVLCFSFSEIATGVLAGGLWLTILVFCGILIRRAKRLSSKIAVHRIPDVCVIREGKQYRISARDVVPGDLLVLKKGDILPADCRLLWCDAAFRLLTLYPDKDGNTVQKLLPKNPETVYPYKAQQFAPFFENMLYGRSEVLSGECRALVVETGYRTFWGAMMLYTGADVKEEPERISDAVAPYLKVFTLASFLLILPLLLIGIFTAPKDTSLLRIVTPAFALLASGSKSVLTLLFRSLPRHTADQILSSSPAENRAILKGREADERLSSITDLIVLGRYASSDGKAHLFRCAVGTGEISLAGSPSALTPLSEAYWLLDQAQKALPATSSGPSKDRRGLATTISELLLHAPVDEEAIKIRVQSTQLYSNPDGTYILEASSAGGSYRLVFSNGEGMIHHCTGYEGAEGRVFSLSESQQLALHHFTRSSVAEGARIVTVVRQAYGRSVLLGVLALREQMQAVLPSALEELRQCGVRVSFFLEENAKETAAYVNAAGLPNAQAPSSRLPEDPQEMLKYYAKYRVFSEVDRKQILALVQTLRRAKQRVAVLGGAAEDLAILNASSLAIAPEPLSLDERSKEASPPQMQSETDLDEPAAQTVRDHADLLICRPGHIAGGILAILQAIAFTRSTKHRAKLLLRYLTCSNLLRWGFFTLSILFGIGLPNAVQILLSGVLIDLLAYVWILHLPILQSRLRKKIAFDPPTVLRCLSDRTLLIAPLAVIFLIGGGTVVLGRLSLLSNAVAVSVIFFSILLCQITLLYLNAFRSGFPAVGRIWLLPLLPVFLVVLTLLASVLQGAVAAVTEIGCWSLLGVILAVSAPLLLLLFTSLFSRFPSKNAK